ncbi:hypothetical protein [Paenibacillus sp. FSL M8-0142]|uniref:hypothetical protein n=1 Tax=Paenibacillus sp. FSL M8-0142 TaxID=2954525 RepID=UPI003159D46E
MDGYLKFVKSVANEQNKVFIMDTGEGDDFADPVTGWYMEDISGWLIEPSKENLLIQAINQGTPYSTFKDNYVFAKWYNSDDGENKVKFVRY